MSTDSAKAAQHPPIALDGLDLGPAEASRADGPDPATVADYVELYRASGARAMDAIVVYRSEETDGQTRHYVSDGLHRITAARKAELKKLPAEIRAGGYRDALLAAGPANARHGKARTVEDKRHYVRKLFDDPEIAAWSDKKIAGVAKVSADLVAKIRTKAGKRTAVRRGKDGKERKVIDSRKMAKERQSKAAAATGAAQADDAALVARQDGVRILAAALGVGDAAVGVGDAARDVLYELGLTKRQVLAGIAVEQIQTGRPVQRAAIVANCGGMPLDVHPGQLARDGIIVGTHADGYLIEAPYLKAIRGVIHRISAEQRGTTTTPPRPTSPGRDGADAEDIFATAPAAIATSPPDTTPPPSAPTVHVDSRRAAHVRSAIAAKARLVAEWQDLRGGIVDDDVLELICLVGIDSGELPRGARPMDILAIRLAKNLAHLLDRGQTAHLPLPRVAALFGLDIDQLHLDAVAAIPE